MVRLKNEGYLRSADGKEDDIIAQLHELARAFTTLQVRTCVYGKVSEEMMELQPDTSDAKRAPPGPHDAGNSQPLA